MANDPRINISSRKSGQTLLHTTAGYRGLVGLGALGAAGAVAVLLAAGARVDEQADYGKWTALHMASEAGVTDVVDVLLANGASTSIKTARGETAAYLAVRWRRWQ